MFYVDKERVRNRMTKHCPRGDYNMEKMIYVPNFLKIVVPSRANVEGFFIDFVFLSRTSFWFSQGTQKGNGSKYNRDNIVLANKRINIRIVKLKGTFSRTSCDVNQIVFLYGEILKMEERERLHPREHKNQLL